MRRLPRWAWATLGAALLLMVTGLALDTPPSPRGAPGHGYVLVEALTRQEVTGCLVLGSVLVAMSLFARLKLVSAATVVVVLLGAVLAAALGPVAGPTRGKEFPSPDGHLVIRFDDLGFADHAYQPIVLERAGVRSRYWRADILDVDDESDNRIRAPRWHDDRTVEIVTDEWSITYRVDDDGLVQVS